MDEESRKELHKKASLWRHKKLKELEERERAGALTEIEKYLIKRIAEIYGEDF